MKEWISLEEECTKGLIIEERRWNRQHTIKACLGESWYKYQARNMTTASPKSAFGSVAKDLVLQQTSLVQFLLLA
jgi:hypothetical protein